LSAAIRWLVRKRGPEHARADLSVDRLVILTPDARTDTDAV